MHLQESEYCFEEQILSVRLARYHASMIEFSILIETANFGTLRPRLSISSQSLNVGSNGIVNTRSVPIFSKIQLDSS